jgi:hypothetical protein
LGNHLAPYVFQVAISNKRIVRLANDQVSFVYTDARTRQRQTCTLEALAFIDRFLQHVLPKGFVKVRHFGFLSPNFAVPLQKIRELICVLYELLRAQPVQARPPSKPKPLRCTRCSAILKWVKFLAPARSVAMT